MLTAMNQWNAFPWPLVVVTEQDMFTVQIGVRAFQTAYGTKWALTMAATSFVTIPVLLMFFFGQRYIVRGIVLTGVK